MSTESPNIPFWHESNHQGGYMPDYLRSAGRDGKISEADFEKAANLCAKANTPHGAGSPFTQQDRDTLIDLFRRADIENPEERVATIEQLAG